MSSASPSCEADHIATAHWRAIPDAMSPAADSTTSRTVTLIGIVSGGGVA